MQYPQHTAELSLYDYQSGKHRHINDREVVDVESFTVNGSVGGTGNGNGRTGVSSQHPNGSENNKYLSSVNSALNTNMSKVKIGKGTEVDQSNAEFRRRNAEYKQKKLERKLAMEEAHRRENPEVEFFEMDADDDWMGFETQVQLASTPTSSGSGSETTKASVESRKKASNN